jgi:esterase/lipase
MKLTIEFSITELQKMRQAIAGSQEQSMNASLYEIAKTLKKIQNNNQPMTDEQLERLHGAIKKTPSWLTNHHNSS